jgi:excisionase family DNA binding protein
MTNREPKATRRLLRLKPAAEYLSVSPGTLRAIVQRGELPIIKLAETGHAPWLLDVRDLDGWVERSKATL